MRKMGADTSASHGAMSSATAPRSSRKRKHDECATSSTSADASTDATAPGTWNDTDPATPPKKSRGGTRGAPTEKRLRKHVASLSSAPRGPRPANDHHPFQIPSVSAKVLR